MNKLVALLRERAGLAGHGSPAMLEGGASFAYVFGKVLVFLLLVEAITGAALAAFYSPSVTDAWASVAYLQDQTTWGWFVRGLHHHAGGALVIVAGLHLVQTAVAGAYKKPRELVWWLGLLLLVLVLAWAVTGYVLRWDQAGYWANRVELGIAAGTPIVGDTLRDVALGGNDYGNLTLTRFYALHVIVLPAIVLCATVAHVWIARRHGITPVARRPAAPRWPDQALRDTLAMALTTAILIGYVISEHGVELAAPADPAEAYDARPLWYFRWLFELRELAGSAETIAAMAAPAVVGGFLAGLPILDKGPERAPGARKLWLGALAGLLAVIGGLTVMSLLRDGGDSDLDKRQAAARTRAERARELARSNGVPVTGAQDIWATQPMYRARVIYAQKCQNCHEGPEREGPLIGPGFGNRAWLAAFLQDPSGDVFYGRTELVKSSLLAQKQEQERGASEDEAKDDDKKDEPQDLAMKPVELAGADLADLVEVLYAQTGASDVDAAKAERGAKIFDSACTDCHAIGEGVAGSAGPGLGGLHSRDWFTSFIGNPKAAIHLTEAMSQMPRFDQELSIVERDALAEYLVWLRSATQADLDALGPL
jgi:ubiquinol-cytochrome c reductase cytochrome b subunit